MNHNARIRAARTVLNLSAQDGPEEAKKQYREMAKHWHPDVNPGQEAHEKMQEINEAFAVLMKEEFGILDFWEDYHRWWWRQYGNDPIWGNVYPDEPAAPFGEKRVIAGKAALKGEL